MKTLFPLRRFWLRISPHFPGECILKQKSVNRAADLSKYPQVSSSLQPGGSTGETVMGPDKGGFSTGLQQGVWTLLQERVCCKLGTLNRTW